MDLYKLLQTIEELIYDISMMVFLIPKTFIHIILHPEWAQTYVDSELKKEPNKRFDDYQSPVFFWLIVAVIPYMYSNLPYIGVGWVPYLYENYSEELHIVITTFILVSLPLIFSICLLTLNREDITKTTVKRYFFAQCYILTPAFLLFLPIIYCSNWADIESRCTSILSNNTSIVIATAVSIWVLISQGHVIRSNTGLSLIKSYFLALCFMWATLSVAVLTILLPLMIWEHFYINVALNQSLIFGK